MRNLFTDRRVLIVHVVAVLCLVTNGRVAAQQADAAMAERIQQQLAAKGRGEYDSIKDPGRKPVETMAFFGVSEGMTVLDATTGSGYNAEILSAAVGPEGLVYAQNSHYILDLINGAHHHAMRDRLQDGRLANVRYMLVDAADMPFDGSMDMVFWGYNMHDVYNKGGEDPTLERLKALKKALKPGGVLAIAEHVGVAGNDNAELHRLETDIVYNMLRKAGFKVEEISDLLANPEDDHSKSIYADDLRYYTDRILVRARKPE